MQLLNKKRNNKEIVQEEQNGKPMPKALKSFLQLVGLFLLLFSFFFFCKISNALGWFQGTKVDRFVSQMLNSPVVESKISEYEEEETSEEVSEKVKEDSETDLVTEKATEKDEEKTNKSDVDKQKTNF